MAASLGLRALELFGATADHFANLGAKRLRRIRDLRNSELDLALGRAHVSATIAVAVTTLAHPMLVIVATERLSRLGLQRLLDDEPRRLATQGAAIPSTSCQPSCIGVDGVDGIAKLVGEDREEFLARLLRALELVDATALGALAAFLRPAVVLPVVRLSCLAHMSS